MSEPPRAGGFTDPHFDLTYAAVGKALSAWERLEVHLSHLHSIFIGRPRHIDAMIDYGREGRIFSDRMRVLSQAGERYFRARPDQALEAELDGIIDRAVSLSTTRHRVAHGLVVKLPIADDDTDREIAPREATEYVYTLVPPWYALHTLTKTDRGLYLYNSQRLLEFGKQFLRCASEARDLGLTLDEPAKELAEFVSQYDEMDMHQVVHYSR